MKKKIYFIEDTIPFDFDDLNSPHIAGTEKTLINISLELSKTNSYDVIVFNRSLNEKSKKNLLWTNLDKLNNFPEPDILVASSDSGLLNLINAKKKFIWSHSVQSIEKFIRKKQLSPFLKNKPIVILEGQYHFDTRSFFTSFYGKKVLKLAADYDFINSKIDPKFIPEKNVIFNTRNDRNLDLIIDNWFKIRNNNSDVKLLINPPFKENEFSIKNNIIVRKKGVKSELIKDLINSRVMINPGHKGEVFCLAAEEARVLCLPIITMGYGALKERVEHGVTGFISKNLKEFVQYSKNVLFDDQLYLFLKKNLYERRLLRSYKNVVSDFINIINGN
jgi:glycosyltransferase involved in cell wall biosynthesis